MENYTSQNNFSDNNLFWAKIFNSSYPKSHTCLSTCTTVSYTSQPSTSCYEVGSVEGDGNSEFSYFALNSPVEEANDEGSIPDDSACALDGSFDERVRDDFFDLIHDGEDTAFQCEEEHQPHTFSREMTISDFRPPKSRRFNKNKNRETYAKAWDLIKELFVKCLCKPMMISLIKREMSRNQAAQKYGFKETFKTIKKQAKKMTRNDIIGVQDNKEVTSYQIFIIRALRNLFINFVNDQVEDKIDSMSNTNEEMKQVMIEILNMISKKVHL